MLTQPVLRDQNRTDGLKTGVGHLGAANGRSDSTAHTPNSLARLRFRDFDADNLPSSRISRSCPKRGRGGALGQAGSEFAPPRQDDNPPSASCARRPPTRPANAVMGFCYLNNSPSPRSTARAGRCFKRNRRFYFDGFITETAPGGYFCLNQTRARISSVACGATLLPRHGRRPTQGRRMLQLSRCPPRSPRKKEYRETGLGFGRRDGT